MDFHDKPVIQGFYIEGVKYISAIDANKAICENRIHFLDIREQDEVAAEFFDFQNIFFFPMSEIMDRLDHLPLDISVVVISNNGIRAVKVANMLNRQGYRSVAVMDGGIKEWKSQKLPIIETGFKNESCVCEASSCGCSCSGCN